MKLLLSVTLMLLPLLLGGCSGADGNSPADSAAAPAREGASGPGAAARKVVEEGKAIAEELANRGRPGPAASNESVEPQPGESRDAEQATREAAERVLNLTRDALATVTHEKSAEEPQAAERPGKASEN